MNVLVIGKGGREHALAWKLSLSPRVKKLFCAPGNPGTATIASNIPIEVDETSLKKIRDELKDKVLQAANASAGNLPASIARLVDHLVEPKINWRDFIRETIQSQLTSDYTYRRPNRRHHGGDVVFASLEREETVDVEVSIDQSGSISADMARDFLSEIMGMLSS